MSDYSEVYDDYTGVCMGCDNLYPQCDCDKDTYDKPCDKCGKVDVYECDNNEDVCKGCCDCCGDNNV